MEAVSLIMLARKLLESVFFHAPALYRLTTLNVFDEVFLKTV